VIEDKKVLAIIPARGGSKGVPRKNIREVAGKPLIAWTIEEAKKSKYIDRLVLSSEDAEIIKVAKEWACDVPFVRPAELSQDETPGIEPVLHAIQSLPGYDYVVLLQPTSPLRKVEDIDGCIETIVAKKAKCCVTVTEPEKSPYWMHVINPEGKLSPLITWDCSIHNRQSLPKVFSLNGAVYVANVQWLAETKSFLSRDTVPYEMPRDRSLDIDTYMDLDFMIYLINTGKII
jgi:CMP-N,N'-diacetyllegionaminic acid synthase